MKVSDVLYLDKETFNETPIKHGTVRYAETVEDMLVPYAISEGDVELWDLMRGEPMPRDLRDALADRSIPIVSHYSVFERLTSKSTGVFGDAYIEPDRFIDTMVQAYCHGLPGSLDALCTIFGLEGEDAKDKEGRSLIQLFCTPFKNGTRATEQSHPEKWARFREYAKRDVRAMRILHKKMPRWNYPGVKYREGKYSQEYHYWVLDQKINDRGFLIDTELAKGAIEATESNKKVLDQKTVDATNGKVQAATQRDEMLKVILDDFGVKLPDMRADTLQRRIEDPNLPQALKDLLAVRIASGRNASAKYRSALNSVSHDGRLRHTSQFCGAYTTGRFSGRVFQPQNLMRPTMEPGEIEEAIEDIKCGLVEIYDNVAEVLGNCVRGLAIAPKGKKFIVCDWRSIEGRKLAWLAGEQYVLDFYEDVDRGRVNYDNYMLAYSSVFGVPPEKVTPEQRKVGKPIELAFGYGGGVAAFRTFAAVYHLDLAYLADRIWEIGDRNRLNECSQKYHWAKKHGFHAGLDEKQYAAFEYTKQVWREARPQTVAFWGEVELAVKQAIMYEKETFTAGPIRVKRNGMWLRIRLPSGRCLVLLQPKVDESGISYAGQDHYTRKWGRIHTHGGKLTGVITQACASDILRKGLSILDSHGYDPVLHVHDEIIIEVEDDPLEFNLDNMIELLTGELITQCKWTKGLPLAAEGFETYRYRKE